MRQYCWLLPVCSCAKHEVPQTLRKQFIWDSWLSSGKDQLSVSDCSESLTDLMKCCNGVSEWHKCFRSGREKVMDDEPILGWYYMTENSDVIIQLLRRDAVLFMTHGCALLQLNQKFQINAFLHIFANSRWTRSTLRAWRSVTADCEWIRSVEWSKETIL